MRKTLRLIWIWIALTGTLGVLSLFSIAQQSAAQEQAPTITLDSITVTAQNMDDYIRNHPEQVTITDRDEITRRNFLNVEETLNSMPGVEVRPSAGIGSRISIRGSGKSGGVLVLLNGRPLNSSQYGGADLSTIPIDIVKSVIVFKPPVPVWLGPGASEGAISIITHDFKPSSAKEKKRTTRLKVDAGSFGQADAAVSHTAPLAAGSLMLTAAGGHLDGKRSNTDKDKGDISIHWDHKGEDAPRFELNGRYYMSEHGSPGPTDNPTPDARQRYEKGSFDVKAQGLIKETGDYSIGAYADHVSLKDESQSGFTSDLTDIKVGLKADTTWSDLGEVWALRMGGLLERDDVDHTLSGEHHRTTTSIHAQVDRRMGPATATLGARGDHTSDFDFDPGLSGGISLAASNNLVIKANAGYSVNVPTFNQLYQPSHGSIDQVRGNPELDEEKIVSYDLGLEYRLRRDRVLQATLFRTETRDLIVYRRDANLIYAPVNINKAWRQGVELTAKQAWEMGLSVDLSYILQDSENEDTTRELAYTPRNTVKVTGKYTIPRLDTRLEATVRYTDERNNSESDNGDVVTLADYATVDLKLLQPFKLGKAAWEAYLNITNLFDEQFENHYGYPDDGLRFIAGLNVTF
jgi:vitamin B12 transporter